MLHEQRSRDHPGNEIIIIASNVCVCLTGNDLVSQTMKASGKTIFTVIYAPVLNGAAISPSLTNHGDGDDDGGCERVVCTTWLQQEKLNVPSRNVNMKRLPVILASFRVYARLIVVMVKRERITNTTFSKAAFCLDRKTVQNAK